MSNKYKQRQRESRQRALVYLRYVLPLICVVLTLITLCIPCLQYTNNQSGTDDPISGFELMKNSWDQVRRYLFGTAQQTNGNILFSRSVLILLIGSWILFALSAVTAVWVLIALLRYTERGTEEKKGRVWLITLIPNRVVLCILHALVLPLAAFPRLVIWLYRSVIYVAVELDVLFVEPLWVALALFAATVILSCVTAPYEKSLGLDPFRKPKKETDEAEEAEPEREPEREPSEEMSESDRRYYELAERARKEQAARIAELFRVKDGDEKNEHKD